MEGSGAILVTARNRFSSSLVRQPRVQGRSKCSGGRSWMTCCIRSTAWSSRHFSRHQPTWSLTCLLVPLEIYQMGHFSPWDRHSFCPMTVAAAVAGYYHSSDSISILPGTAACRSCIMHHSSPEYRVWFKPSVFALEPIVLMASVMTFITSIFLQAQFLRPVSRPWHRSHSLPSPISCTPRTDPSTAEKTPR